MSIYLDLLKSKIGYTEHQYPIADTPSLISTETPVEGLTKISPTDHRSLGQVVTLDEGSNIASDTFDSIELHEKSKEALNDLKHFLKTNH
jgi:hypothetical protein